MAWPSGLNAQSGIEIELSKETYPEVRLAVTSFKLGEEGSDPTGFGQEARDILQNDLRLSEYFNLLDRESFAEQEEMELGQGSVDFNAWNQLGVQWVVKTQYAIHHKRKTFTIVFRLYDAVNERFLLGKRYRGTREYSRKIIHRFADEIIAQLTGKRGVSETQLAFISREDQNKEVYLVDFDGFNLKRLTHDRSVALSPTWSPDGRNLLYTSYLDHNPDLVMIDLSGKHRRTVLKLPGLNAAPAWSPDGSRIALTLSKDQNAEVYILKWNRRLLRLTRHFNIDTSPAWSPDGKRIAFTSDRSGTGAPQIYIMDARNGDESPLKRISFDSSYNDDAAWSPNGDQIAYTSRVGRKFRIKIYDLTLKKSILFTNGPGTQENPAWSPDGRFLAYTHKENGKSEIYVKKLGSDKVRQVTFLSGGGVSPAWSPYAKR